MKKATLLLLVFCQTCQAEVVRYEEANCSIDVPASWKKAETPPEALALFRSADQSKGVTLMTFRFSAEDAPTALEKMMGGAKKAAQKSNVPITGEHDQVVDGVNFRTYTVTRPGNVTVISRMAVVGVRGFSIQGFSRDSDAATDPEIVGMLDSFRLLTKPPTSSVANPSSESAAYKFGQMVGRLAFIALIAGATVIMLKKAFRGSKSA